METNFIPNVHNVVLDRWTARGPGENMMINMANGHFICHLSEFPAGTYKKAHTGEANRKRSGLVSDVAYLFLSGEGYDLQWPEGVYPSPGTEWEQLDYKAGTLMSPGTGYHQHFNCSAEPSAISFCATATPGTRDTSAPATRTRVGRRYSSRKRTRPYGHTSKRSWRSAGQPPRWRATRTSLRTRRRGIPRQPIHPARRGPLRQALPPPASPRPRPAGRRASSPAPLTVQARRPRPRRFLPTRALPPAVRRGSRCVSPG